ncbi:hypothetical protein D4S03_10995 [bacterium]|nr:MAG: hypothetical protein D4S03_10995 [bacterium]
MNNPWSKNGVALYPPKYPVVGQSRIFNALVNFRQQFSEQGDLSGFFVLVGDWGLGKTRIGYELIAEAVGQIDKWLLDPNREYVAPNTNQRVLEPQFANQTLPLFIDYHSVTDHLAADIWTPKVACNALELLWNRPADLRVSSELLDDLVAALKAKGVSLTKLQQAVEGGEDWKVRLEKAMQVLRPHDIHYLWIIVDEVETPGDLRRNPDYIPGREVEEEDLAMISQVIKEARYRDLPYVNFLLLCSVGMSDAIQIGPNRRRANLAVLEPNRIYDVQTFQKYLSQAEIDVNYPAGTLEGVFIATNRNFGWFNNVMSSIHAIWVDAQQRGNPVNEAWKLINAYAMSVSNKEIFDLSILDTMSGIARKTPEHALSQQMIFGQLPILADPTTISPEVAKRLLKANIPAIGDAFARLHQIHIDANTLANELLKLEYGFKKSERAGDDYFTPYTEFSLSGVLSALRAFSISIDNPDDFVVYASPDQFAEQLATLYPREREQDGKTIEQAAAPLHHIFMRYIVKDREYIGVSFKLLKKINVKMGTGRTPSPSFFRDRNLDIEIEDYVRGKATSSKFRMRLICEGMAKVIDDTVEKWLIDSPNEDFAYISFESKFNTPQTPGLNVTLKGRVTVAYCGDPQKTAKELSDMLGKVSSAQPILILFGPSSDLDAFQRELERIPLLKKSVILRKITNFEEEFLLKYSGKGSEFNPDQKPLSHNTLATRENLRQDLQLQFKSWKQALDQSGLILRPIWVKSTNISKEDFFTGYRYLLAIDGTIDALDPASCQIPNWNPQKLDNFRSAAKKNVSPGLGSSVELLSILKEEPYKPMIPITLLQVLRELHSQASEDSLKKRFFFANREQDAAMPTMQILELMEAIGLIYRPGGPNSALYMAVNKNQLESQCTIIKQWLQNQAPSLIRDIQDIFPARATELEKADLSTANAYLKQADEMVTKMQFGFIENGEPDLQAFIKLVKGVYEFEMLIMKIRPLEQDEVFNINSEQIKTYQDRYSSLSLWEKVHFLGWLRKLYIEKQNQIQGGIDGQLAEIASYITNEHKPIPTAPITQLLRQIENEVHAPIAGGTQTSMGWLSLPEYTLSISRYFLAQKYTDGWKRLEALDGLAAKTGPDSLWQRFARQTEAWKGIVNLSLQAKQAWDHLNAFLNDAPRAVKTESGELGKEYQTLEDIIEGGLENDIQQQIKTKLGIELLDTLEIEVSALEKYQGLPTRISEFMEGVLQNLRDKINKKRLEALNHALRAAGKPDWLAPEGESTYQKTLDAYKEFNNNVDQQGKKLFDGKGKQTNWEMWVQIYTMFDKGESNLKPEHEPNINELVEMGLLVRTISLKR